MYLRTCARICLEEVFIFHYFMRFVCSSIGGTKNLNLEVIEMEVFDVKVLSILADFVGILDWIGLDTPNRIVINWGCKTKTTREQPFRPDNLVVIEGRSTNRIYNYIKHIPPNRCRKSMHSC